MKSPPQLRDNSPAGFTLSKSSSFTSLNILTVTICYDMWRKRFKFGKDEEMWQQILA